MEPEPESEQEAEPEPEPEPEAENFAEDISKVYGECPTLMHCSPSSPRIVWFSYPGRHRHSRTLLAFAPALSPEPAGHRTPAPSAGGPTGMPAQPRRT